MISQQPRDTPTTAMIRENPTSFHIDALNYSISKMNATMDTTELDEKRDSWISSFTELARRCSSLRSPVAHPTRNSKSLRPSLLAMMDDHDPDFHSDPDFVDASIGCDDNDNECDGILQPYDIICGRQSQSLNYIGNRRFRVTISLNLHQYRATADDRKKRAELITNIIKVLNTEAGAKFLKIKGGTYVELSKREIRQKVAHALRDMAHHQDGSRIASPIAETTDIQNSQRPKKTVRIDKLTPDWTSSAGTMPKFQL
jgi:hypothetical protein